MSAKRCATPGGSRQHDSIRFSPRATLHPGLVSYWCENDCAVVGGLETSPPSATRVGRSGRAITAGVDVIRCAIRCVLPLDVKRGSSGSRQGKPPDQRQTVPADRFYALPALPLCTPVNPPVFLPCTPVYPCVPLCTPVYPCPDYSLTVPPLPPAFFTPPAPKQ
jgi:hypothetical protein